MALVSFESLGVLKWLRLAASGSQCTLLRQKNEFTSVRSLVEWKTDERNVFVESEPGQLL